MYPISNPAKNANIIHLAKSRSVQIALCIPYCSILVGISPGFHLLIAFTLFDKLYQGIYLDQLGTTIDVFELKKVSAFPAQLVYVELFI